MINVRQYEANKFEIYAIGQPQDLLSGVLLNGLGPLDVYKRQGRNLKFN